MLARRLRPPVVRSWTSSETARPFKALIAVGSRFEMKAPRTAGGGHKQYRASNLASLRMESEAHQASAPRVGHRMSRERQGKIRYGERTRGKPELRATSQSFAALAIVVSTRQVKTVAPFAGWLCTRVKLQSPTVRGFEIEMRPHYLWCLALATAVQTREVQLCNMHLESLRMTAVARSCIASPSISVMYEFTNGMHGTGRQIER